MLTFILFQENESDNLIKPFTDLQLAIDYALKDIMVFDGIEGMVERQDNDDNVVAVISSDQCESPYVIFKEEMNQVRLSAEEQANQLLTSIEV